MQAGVLPAGSEVARRLLGRAIWLLVAAISLSLPAEGLYFNLGGGTLFPYPPNRVACYGRSYSSPAVAAPDPFLGHRPVRCGRFVGQPIYSTPPGSLVPTAVVLDYFGQRLEYTLSGGP